MKKIVHIFGMSNTGKSTLAKALKSRLQKTVELIDADDYRKTLNSDLGFSKEDRLENIRRLLSKANESDAEIVIVCAVTPYEESRDNTNYNIFLRSPIQTLLNRDIEKGIYNNTNVAGVDSPFESPQTVKHLQLDTSLFSIDECVDRILSYIDERPKYAMFVGRWQTLHDGHDWLFNQKLQLGENVLIAIRDVNFSEKDKLTAEEVKENLKVRYKDLIETGRIKLIIIPDITSINYGRDVGYEVTEHVPPAEIKQISGTSIRSKLNN